jgi:hypothetical protein
MGRTDRLRYQKNIVGDVLLSGCRTKRVDMKKIARPDMAPQIFNSRSPLIRFNPLPEVID